MMARFEVLGIRRVVGVIASLLLTLLLVAEMATAGQTTAASIIGQVTDESGAVLPGVTVTATSPALQVPQVTGVSDERGEYRLTPLPVGTYAVVYELAGFQSVRREDLRLTVAFVAKVDVALKVGALAETVTVSGAAPVVDVASGAASTQFTRENLELTVSSRNGLTSLLAQAPGVRTTWDVGGSGNTEQTVFRAFGQAGEPWNTLEGVFTSTMQGTGGNGNYFDYTTYDEARVSTVGNNAEMPTRGIQITAVVKSGGNELHGNAWWGQHLVGIQADNLDDALKAQGITRGKPIVRRYDLSSDLGGKIIQNKLWFYAAVRRRVNVTEEPNCFVFGSAALKDGSPCVSAQPIWFLTEKVSYQMNPSNRLVFFNQYTKKWDMDAASEFRTWESRNNDVTPLETRKIEWQGVRGNALVMSLQFGAYQFRGTFNSNDKGPYVDRQSGDPIGVATFDIFTTKQAGEAPNVGGRVIERHRHTKGNVTWYRPDLFYGNHEFKTGFDYLALMNSRGQVARQKGAYQLVFNNGVPFQIRAQNIPTFPHQSINYIGLYVEDAWTLARRLTLHLGLRYAHDDGFIPATCRAAGDFTPAECFDKRQFNVWSTVAPRLHAAYDVTGDGKTVIKGGWGRFDHMRQLGELQLADPNSTTTWTYNWRDLNNNRDYDPGEVNLGVNGPDFVSQSGGSNTVPNPNEQEPKADEFSLSFERELMANLGLRLTGIYSRTPNPYRTENVLRPSSAYTIPVTRPDPGSDGRAGTADDPGTSFTYYEFPLSLAGRNFERFTFINDPRAGTSYKSFEIAAFKRLSNGLMIMTSYSATKKNVPFVNGLNPSQSQSTVSAAAADPNAELFAADRTWESVGKITGAYVLPAEVTVSVNYEHRDGLPWARQVLFTGGQTIPSITLRVEPIGARRLPSLDIVNVRFQKGFRLTPTRKLEVRANIYNLMNINTVLGVTMRAGTTFLKPTSIVEPRIMELSTSFSF